MRQLQLAFYGDDFTGSTDAMDALQRSGIRTVLFMEPPSPETLTEEFDDVQAVGVAGTSRTMMPAEMDEALPEVFGALASLDVPIVHYKVCSTFDSSPEVGSIGHAIDLAQSAFDAPFVPLLVGAPPLGRFVAFGNLFAEYEGDIYRIDRHPVMSDHPITPMNEGDLQRHLGKQTDRPISSLNLLDLGGTESEVDERLSTLVAGGAEIVLFDGVETDHLRHAGRAVWKWATERASDDSPLFAVGSSGFEYALTEHWDASGAIDRFATDEPPGPSGPVVVMSGSASPVTETQIEYVLDAGFEGVRIDTERLVNPDVAADARQEAIDEALAHLKNGTSVVLYTALGPGDPVIERTREAAADVAGASQDVGYEVSVQQGHILDRILRETDVDRACIAGGDTSGHVTSELDIYALEVETPIDPGAPLCRAHSETDAFDGLSLALKGGQLGDRDFFESVRRGRKTH
jgi:uncharacterized protein YgbK (DUF1537 family)